jgi:hypothetical protein
MRWSNPGDLPTMILAADRRAPAAASASDPSAPRAGRG